MTYTLKAKIWIEKEGEKVFGDGPYDLLQRVGRLGSLSQAAKEMSMSYSQAWHLIKNLEKKLGFPLLEKQAGGPAGGYSALTSAGISMLEFYDTFHKEAEKKLEALFHKHLGSLPDLNK